jgi:hypothetical protein
MRLIDLHSERENRAERDDYLKTRSVRLVDLYREPEHQARRDHC